MLQQLQLNKSLYIASGTERHFYLQPTEPCKLLKIMRPQLNKLNHITFRDITTQFFSSLHLRLIRKEYDKYIRIQLKKILLKWGLPIAYMFRLAQTNLGLACVAKSITGEASPMVRTLQQKFEIGTTGSADATGLKLLVLQFCELGILARDLKLRRLVLIAAMSDINA